MPLWAVTLIKDDPLFDSPWDYPHHIRSEDKHQHHPQSIYAEDGDRQEHQWLCVHGLGHKCMGIDRGDKTSDHFKSYPVCDTMQYEPAIVGLLVEPPEARNQIL